MIDKRFKLRLSKLGDGMITDTQKREDLYFDKEFLDATLPKTNEWLNELADENEQLRKENDMLSCELSVSANKEISRNCRIAELEEENEQLKTENTMLKEHQNINCQNCQYFVSDSVSSDCLKREDIGYKGTCIDGMDLHMLAKNCPYY